MTKQEHIHKIITILKADNPDIYNKKHSDIAELINEYTSVKVTEEDIKEYFQPTLEESIEDLVLIYNHI